MGNRPLSCSISDLDDLSFFFTWDFNCSQVLVLSFWSDLGRYVLMEINFRNELSNFFPRGTKTKMNRSLK